ncbi:TonB-dependent receptor [Aquimarina muelleri]|uniref:isocitrate dehydrogenase (NADP(+)) n=1 Tax=Aquimarina muelleri TaxID=279356 RepID=A0A918N5Y5_9FLAO|nr:TonB-dependent receptor [Aquimarina muelleri]MCX2764522.1 TonB-dependent receptor [Aquimarina muelleri]GGX33115.1 collagen-binding protein [Aquimarina muelleri]
MFKKAENTNKQPLINNQIILLFFILFTTILSAQENYTISGTIKDANNGETLLGASIFFKDTTIGEITNEYGFYSITAPKGNYILVISYIGFTEINKEVTLDSNQNIDFELKESTNQLDEVVITSEEPERAMLQKPEIGVSKLNIKTIKQIPVVLGEVDVMKALQLLPGVSNVGEASSGFNVRGGAVDQNLVLLDEAIIYNTSHLFGFFSVFNADAIKNTKLYKGGIPARFGGRVSSVLDIRQKDGNSKNFAFTGGIGLISSRLAIEGPVFKEKGSFLLAGRASYGHLLLKSELNGNSARFSDFNLKTNYEINKNNKLFLSGYLGRDNFVLNKDLTASYGNISGNLRWNHLFNDKLFSNASAIFSSYDYNLGINLLEYDWISSIKNYNLKYDLRYYASERFKLDFGTSIIYYDFRPGEIKPNTDESSVNPYELDQKRAVESALYVDAEHKFSDKLTAQYGLRYSGFNRLGGQVVKNYLNNQPVVYNDFLGIYQRGVEIEGTNFEKSETVKSFGNLEPRFSLAYQLSESSSIKAGYSRVAQYIHLLSNTTSVSPLDVWTPSGKYIKPQLSNQYALGYFKNFKNEIYSLEAEVYYKTIDNRIDYIDGSTLIANNAIEAEILNGESRAYGLEVLVRKNEGRLTGWLTYTLSKSEQRTPGGSAGGLGIENGAWYDTAYDRTHDFSLTGAYKLNEKWTLGTNLVFQTGRPVTYPNGQYIYGGLSIASYSDRNSDRLPVYHRLDFSATYRPNRKPNKKWKGEWVFGIYNVYNRKNATSISFEQNIATGVNEATRTAIFGIVPSITYNFKF